MRARAELLQSKLFPQGYVDVLRQIVLFAGAYYVYRLLRGVVDDDQGAAIAFQNARHIVSFEQTFGFFSERTIQKLTGGWSVTTDIASLIYLNAQTTVVLGSIIYLYIRHNERYYFVRNMMIVAMTIALVGYVLYPTAPPRFFFPEYGFRDTVSEFTGVAHNDVGVNALFNPYAAMPSMHCCFAIIVGGTLAKLARRRVTRVLWLCYPLLMTWVVVVTGNHWFLDALLGGVAAALSFAAARSLARSRPAAWAFTRAPEPARVRA